jgi:hypothetical protein
MGEHMPEHDPRSEFEDEGIPDLQDGTPQQQWAVDPQQAPLPGDRPIAIDDFGTTAEEQREGESLTGRLAREVPEEQPIFGEEGPASAPVTDEDLDTDDEDLTEDGGLGVGSDLDTRLEKDSGIEDSWPGQPEEPSGQIWDEPRLAGRLVAEDEGAHPVGENPEAAAEVGPDGGGYAAEEAAMHIEIE